MSRAALALASVLVLLVFLQVLHRSLTVVHSLQAVYAKPEGEAEPEPESIPESGSTATSVTTGLLALGALLLHSFR
jgi:hypothetical protein